MSEEIELSPSQVVADLPWYLVWLKAIARPSVTSYQELVVASGAPPTRTYTWVFITAVIGSLLWLLASGAWRVRPLLSMTTPSPGTETYRLDFSLVCTPLLAAALIVLGFALLVGIIQMAAFALGGTATHAMLAYVMASYTVPLTWISGLAFAAGLLASQPLSRCLLVPFALGLYALALNVIAVKAVHGFGWVQAMGSVLLGYALIVALVTIVNVVGGRLTG